MVIPMTATHAYRGNTPIIIASSVAIHQTGVQTATNIETQREHTDTPHCLRRREKYASENSPE